MRKKMEELNEKLSESSYLHGDGFAVGATDKETFSCMSSRNCDLSGYPHLAKWFRTMERMAAA